MNALCLLQCCRYRAEATALHLWLYAPNKCKWAGCSSAISILFFLNTPPSLPAHPLITCCFGRLHSAVPQCHNEAACSFPNPILSHPRHSEIYIKPHNKECVQPAWPCYWQTYNGDRDLFLGSALCLRDCTWSNRWEREVVKVSGAMALTPLHSSHSISHQCYKALHLFLIKQTFFSAFNTFSFFYLKLEEKIPISKVSVMASALSLPNWLSLEGAYPSFLSLHGFRGRRAS